MGATKLSARLISVAGLVGRPIVTNDGQLVGRVVDLICRNDSGSYPPVAGVIARVGGRRAFIDAAQIETIAGDRIVLGSATMDLHDYERRSGERRLMGHIVDHQLVDIDGVRVVRASDLYLAPVGDQWALVGVDVGVASLVRRLGPARFRNRPTATRVIDWAEVQSFGAGDQPVRLAEGRSGLQRLRPSELADLLEELGRSQRQEFLAQLDPETAADAVEEMDDDDVRELFVDAGADVASDLIAHMEPDEAVDALRDLEPDLREEILAAVPAETATDLRQLLSYDETVAGGIMTSRLVTVRPDQTVSDAAAALAAHTELHGLDVNYVVVVDAIGALIDDITAVELLLADPTTSLAELIAPPYPIAVEAHAPLSELVEALTANRGSSVLVLDDARRPIGRIMADDLVDALATNRRGLMWRKQ